MSIIEHLIYIFVYDSLATTGCVLSRFADGNGREERKKGQWEEGDLGGRGGRDWEQLSSNSGKGGKVAADDLGENSLGVHRELVEGIGGLPRVYRKPTKGIRSLPRVYRELAKEIGSLPGWRQGVRLRKTKSRRKIVRGSRKAYWELGSWLC
ncbi:hypothetical protein B296_00002717 [Ensete ventricosum]|uniref:Uncharacterized protein n=1 Tax=Ensete ventricosum TaxID=4639 RepID=A0A427B5W4_ENSVE|nr:hypothetical protein B296_00002717 [Ensete ventricosum]